MITVSIIKVVAIALSSFALGMAVTNLIYVIGERKNLLKKCDKKRSKGNNNAEKQTLL